MNTTDPCEQVLSNKYLLGIISSNLNEQEHVNAILVCKKWNASICESQKNKIRLEGEELKKKMISSKGEKKIQESIDKINQVKGLKNLYRLKIKMNKNFQILFDFEKNHEKKVTSALQDLKELLPYLQVSEKQPYLLLTEWVKENINIFQGEIANKKFHTSIYGANYDDSVISSYYDMKIIDLPQLVYLLGLKKADTLLLEKLQKLQEKHNI